MVLKPGINILWVSQDEDNAEAIRSKFQIIWKSAARSPGSGFTPDDVLYDNPGQFKLKNNSRLSIRFAGDTKRRSNNVGRGDTIHFAVFTEVAYWPFAKKVYEAMSPGMKHARPSVVWDTTPNGTTGDGEFFYRRVTACLEGRIGGVVHFWSWWEEPKYSEVCSGWDELGALSEQEQWLVDHKNLRPGQIKWRRAAIADLDDDEEAFKEIYPESYEEAWRSRGSSIFSRDVIALSKKRLSDKAFRDAGSGSIPQKYIDRKLVGDGQTSRIMASRNLSECCGQGYLRVWRPFERGKRYFAGIDTSQGLPKSDWLVCVIIDMECRICAILRCKVRTVLFAGMAQRLIEYFSAEAGIENQSTGPEIQRYLRECMTEAEIKRYMADSCLVRPVRCQLIQNNRATRPIMVTHLTQSIDGRLTAIPDAETLREVENFERKDDGKIEAASGEHDDILLALAIALRIRELKCLKEREHGSSSFYDEVGDGRPEHVPEDRSWRLGPAGGASWRGESMVGSGQSSAPEHDVKASPANWA